MNDAMLEALRLYQLQQVILHGCAVVFAVAVAYLVCLYPRRAMARAAIRFWDRVDARRAAK